MERASPWKDFDEINSGIVGECRWRILFLVNGTDDVEDDDDVDDDEDVWSRDGEIFFDVSQELNDLWPFRETGWL